VCAHPASLIFLVRCGWRANMRTGHRRSRSYPAAGAVQARSSRGIRAAAATPSAACASARQSPCLRGGCSWSWRTWRRVHPATGTVARHVRGQRSPDSWKRRLTYPPVAGQAYDGRCLFGRAGGS
jgi:hypothetical protein